MGKRSRGRPSSIIIYQITENTSIRKKRLGRVMLEINSRERKCSFDNDQIDKDGRQIKTVFYIYISTTVLNKLHTLLLILYSFFVKVE